MSLRKLKKAAVEAGEASESDEGESELFRVKPQTSAAVAAASTAAANRQSSGPNRQGISVESCSISSPTVASGSFTSISQELPARPVPCRTLVEANCSLAKGVREAATLPYAVAIKEIDDMALDLVRGQQLMDDVYHVLEAVGDSLQNIEREADQLRAQCVAALPGVFVPPPSQAPTRQPGHGAR